jgi:hypothetical protein
MTERQRLISRLAVAFRSQGVSDNYEAASRFVAEWLDGHKVEGRIADSLGMEASGRWRRLVFDVVKAAKPDI